MNEDRAPGRPLDRQSALPLWAQVRDDLLRRVDGGEFTGSFPGEMALTEEYAVSRQTIRQALRQLRDQGTLIGARGRAPRVANEGALIQQPLGALYSLYASVEAAGLPQHSTVRRLEVCQNAGVAAVLALPPQAPLLYLERLRLAGGEPLAHDHAWLPAVLARPLLDADFTHTALYTELAARCGIRVNGGNEQIRAVIATLDEMTLLGMPADVAALSIERVGCRDGQPVELRRTLVRGDRFAVSAQFSRTAGYHMAPTRSLQTPTSS